MTYFGKFVIVDLDGTLADINHRVHMVKSEKPDWDAFFNACVNDTPNSWCVELIRSMGLRNKVLIVSARSKIVEMETRQWLARVFSGMGVDVELVLLREAGNHEPDVDLKLRWLEEFGKDRIHFVVDDRQRVVDAWRSAGLVCLQCYAWEEHKKKKTPDL